MEGMLRLYSFKGGVAPPIQPNEESKNDDKNNLSNPPSQVNPFLAPDFKPTKNSDNIGELDKAPARQAHNPRITNSPDLLLVKKEAPKNKMIDQSTKGVQTKFQKECKDQLNPNENNKSDGIENRARNPETNNCNDTTHDISLKERNHSEKLINKEAKKKMEISDHSNRITCCFQDEDKKYHRCQCSIF